MTHEKTGLKRRMGLTGLLATGICSMLGASVFIVPFMIQRNVPGIGPYVIPAFLLAAIPAGLAAMAYGILSSAMPRAGGSYIYASRGLNPYLGFIASFSQWFGLSIVIGVVSYVMIPFIRDAFYAMDLDVIGGMLDIDWVRLGLALLFLWTFVYVNIKGTAVYESTVVPLMILMFVLGSIVIVAGYTHTQQDFMLAYAEQRGQPFAPSPIPELSLTTLFTGAAVLFSSFIGFDSVAQAGGEAIRPSRNLPLAIGGTIGIVGIYYILFTGAVYHAIPWSFIAAEAAVTDITAPGLLDYLIPSVWSVPIIAGAAIALVNDLPAMLLSVSRLMFAWSKDGIFPKALSAVHPTYGSPGRAILVSGVTASIGILGCHFARDFFLGVDIMVTSMLVNFFLMCLTLIVLPFKNPELHRRISVFKNRNTQLVIGFAGMLSLSIFMSFHVYKDLRAEVSAWYFHSTPVYLLVMLLASAVYLYYWREISAPDEIFSKLPEE